MRYKDWPLEKKMKHRKRARQYYYAHREEILQKYHGDPRIREKTVERLREKRRMDKSFRKHHTQQIKDWMRRKAKELREEIIERLGGKCKICGFNNVLALEIHHKERKNDYRASKSTGKYGYYRAMLKEIDKVELLCANCHQILHQAKN